LFTRFKTNATTLFIDPNFEGTLEYESGKKVNLILSPSLYWVKKLSLPISSVREVKKLLPSIFEDTLLESHYSYTAYKSGDDFIAFAYEDKKIFDLLKRLGISYSDVVSLHFAQSEFDTIESAFEINASQSIYLKDSLLVLAPTTWLKETQILDVKDIELSKHRVKLQQFGHIVDNSSLYKVGTILIVLALILIVEIFVAKSKLSDVQVVKEELFSKYKLQSTMFQNSASMKKYTKIYTTQTKLREYISYFLSMKLKTGQKITLVEYKNSMLYVSISGVAKGSEGKITSQLNSKGVKFKTSHNNDTIKVEMKL
jgi:hypothetical protein